mgnify:CR=1 FL=1
MTRRRALLGAALAWGGELGHAAQSLDIALRFSPAHRDALAFAAAIAAGMAVACVNCSAER